MLCPSTLKVPITVQFTANAFFTLSHYINGNNVVAEARRLPSGLPRIMTVNTKAAFSSVQSVPYKCFHVNALMHSTDLFLCF